MRRTLIALAAFVSLAGCYNPRYPSEAPDAKSAQPPYDSQDAAARNRRDSAAGSGRTVQPQ